jgi:hypothetical protein
MKSATPFPPIAFHTTSRRCTTTRPIAEGTIGRRCMDAEQISRRQLRAVARHRAAPIVRRIKSSPHVKHFLCIETGQNRLCDASRSCGSICKEVS